MYIEAVYSEGGSFHLSVGARLKAVPVYGKVAANVMSSRKGNNSKQPSAARCSPSGNPPKLSPGWNKVALLTFVRNSPCSCPFSVSLHPPQAALNSEPRKRWRLIVRFTSLHIKPALKGEVANVVSRRGYKAAYSSCLSQPLSQTFGLPAPRKGEPFEERISPHTSARRVTQKFIVETASEKKVRHLACFDDSDASDADVQEFTFSLKTVPISFRFRPRLCAPPPGPWEGRASSLCLRSRQL